MTISNKDVERLYDEYNPNKVRTGEIVTVSIGTKYKARIVGLELDLKNKKVYANLKLLDPTQRVPIRVDAADCYRQTSPLYPGHHRNG